MAFAQKPGIDVTYLLARSGRFQVYIMSATIRVPQTVSLEPVSDDYADIEVVHVIYYAETFLDGAVWEPRNNFCECYNNWMVHKRMPVMPAWVFMYLRLCALVEDKERPFLPCILAFEVLNYFENNFPQL